MKRKQVIERLCSICTQLGEEKFEDGLAHDCFCSAAGNYFNFSREILDYIEKAVNNHDALVEALELYRKLYAIPAEDKHDETMTMWMDCEKQADAALEAAKGIEL